MLMRRTLRDLKSDLWGPGSRNSLAGQSGQLRAVFLGHDAPANASDAHGMMGHAKAAQNAACVGVGQPHVVFFGRLLNLHGRARVRVLVLVLASSAQVVNKSELPFLATSGHEKGMVIWCERRVGGPLLPIGPVKSGSSRGPTTAQG